MCKESCHFKIKTKQKYIQEAQLLLW